MPAHLVFHKGDAFALHRLCDDDTGLALHFACMGKRLFNRIEIVAINDDSVKSKCAELLVDRVRAANLIQRAVDLEVVVVHNQAEVVQFFVGREHRSLPHLALFDFAVAQHGIHAIILAHDLRR